MPTWHNTGEISEVGQEWPKGQVKHELAFPKEYSPVEHAVIDDEEHLNPGGHSWQPLGLEELTNVPSGQVKFESTYGLPT